VLAFGYGCGPKAPNLTDPPPAANKLGAIGRAYMLATDALDRGPLNKDELKPYISPDWADLDVFRSPNDNEEYVILWGLDYRGMDLQGNFRKQPVFAYEKTGKDGKRLVLQGRYVFQVEDEDLTKLPFPPPYQAPRQ